MALIPFGTILGTAFVFALYFGIVIIMDDGPPEIAAPIAITSHERVRLIREIDGYIVGAVAAETP